MDSIFKQPTGTPIQMFTNPQSTVIYPAHMTQLKIVYENPKVYQIAEILVSHVCYVIAILPLITHLSIANENVV